MGSHSLSCSLNGASTIRILSPSEGNFGQKFWSPTGYLLCSLMVPLWYSLVLCLYFLPLVMKQRYKGMYKSISSLELVERAIGSLIWQLPVKGTQLCVEANIQTEQIIIGKDLCFKDSVGLGNSEVGMHSDIFFSSCTINKKHERHNYGWWRLRKCYISESHRKAATGDRQEPDSIQDRII